MKPIDFRNATFEELEAHLAGKRRGVYLALRDHGPCTTRQLAERSGFDILSVRPRVCDLITLGWAVLADEQPDACEGIYRARTLEEWKRWVLAEKERLVNPQLQLV